MKNLLTILTITGCLALASCARNTDTGKQDTETSTISFADKVADFNKFHYANCDTCVKVNRVTIPGFIVVGQNNANNDSSVLIVDLRNYDVNTHTGFVKVGQAQSVPNSIFYELGDTSLLNPNGAYEIYEGQYFEEAKGSGKDLESLGANLESLSNGEISSNLEENYGLSEERAASVAKITSSFKKIQNKRALTAKEMNIYTQKVLGVDYTAGKKALEKHIQGDSADMEKLMDRAADFNGTSPEAVTELMGEYLMN
jgi:hypothetical protein